MSCDLSLCCSQLVKLVSPNPVSFCKSKRWSLSPVIEKTSSIITHPWWQWRPAQVFLQWCTRPFLACLWCMVRRKKGSGYVRLTIDWYDGTHNLLNFIIKKLSRGYFKYTKYIQYTSSLIVYHQILKFMSSYELYIMS